MLEVLQILEGEVNLREETRVAEQAKAGLQTPEYRSEAERLSATQGQLDARLAAVARGIEGLPNGAAEFGRELALLGTVGHVMREAVSILARPDTGAPAIGAETEVIELLLQAQRNDPSGGGGGGSSPGGGSGDASSGDSALTLLGSGLNRNEVRVERAVPQATGDAEPGLPEEFRAGLDAYFQHLERAKSGG